MCFSMDIVGIVLGYVGAPIVIAAQPTKRTVTIGNRRSFSGRAEPYDLPSSAAAHPNGDIWASDSNRDYISLVSAQTGVVQARLPTPLRGSELCDRMLCFTSEQGFVLQHSYDKAPVLCALNLRNEMVGPVSLTGEPLGMVSDGKSVFILSQRRRTHACTVTKIQCRDGKLEIAASWPAPAGASLMAINSEHEIHILCQHSKLLSSWFTMEVCSCAGLWVFDLSACARFWTRMAVCSATGTGQHARSSTSKTLGACVSTNTTTCWC